ncbi:MAG: GtrA family protein [Oscillospiraceae bacterium]|nr:GtrA family protein [Oscillospiraceae bacterium]
MRQLIKKFINRETILYIFFGILTTIVNFSIYWGSQKLFALAGWQGFFHLFDDSKNYDYLDANTLAGVISILFAFFTLKTWVFESKSWEKSVLSREFWSFVASRLFVLLLDQGVMYLLVSVISLDIWGSELILRFWHSPDAPEIAQKLVDYSIIAKFFAQFIIIVLNYVFGKFFVFRNNSKSSLSDGSDG